MLYKTLLIIHIISGSVALIAGAIAILTRKGSYIHITAGKSYYLSMYSVGITSVVMSLIKFNPFLLAIGIFATYMTYSGKVSIENWRIKSNHTPLFRERLPFLIALLTSVVMVIWPVYRMIVSGIPAVPVLSIFGLIMFFNAWRDVKNYSHGKMFIPKNRSWLIQHIGMMSGAYISTVTAFLVVNVNLTPVWLTWLLPTFVGTPLIFLAIRKWKNKLRIS